MTELIFPKNWPKEKRVTTHWTAPTVQRNICPKCHYYGSRFNHDGWCQFCGYKKEE